MSQWELMRDAMVEAHRQGREWLTAGEIVKAIQAVEPSVGSGSLQATVRAYCVNDPSKKHYPGLLYRRNPLLVADDPTMHGKRYRLLTETEREVFLTHPRDDLESISYAQLMEWVAQPDQGIRPQVEDGGLGELEPEEASGPALLELHLQDYLHRHWNAIFPDLRLYQGATGREFRTYEPSVGIVDFLCTDGGNNFVVIETKRSVPDRQAVGQILGYMGWVRERLCAGGQTVRGILIASEATDQLRLAAAAVPDLQIYRYEISFDVRPA